MAVWDRRGHDRTPSCAIILNRVFWKHAKSLLNSKASICSRLRFWKILSFGVADYRFPGMRPNTRNGQLLEADFNVFVRRICAFRPLPGESQATFCSRRNHLASILKREVGAEVRRRWAYKVVTWVEHLRRHPESLGCTFLEIQDDSWLRSQRLKVGKFGGSRSLESGETATRAAAGYPIRFASKWLEALSADGGLTNPERSKTLSKANAHRLFEFCFACRTSAPLSVMDG